MRIEERDYTRDEFKNYLIDHSDEIFEEDQRKKWLKIYCLLVSDDNWQTTLFKNDELTKLGEIFKVDPKTELPNEQNELYYIEEYCPGLLLMYTTANNEVYQQDLGNRIRKSIGVTQMWIKTDLFRIFWKGILEDTNGFVYFFSSTRGAVDDTPCKIRPNYKRRFNYSGDDATQTIEELEEIYGVTPDLVYLKVDEDLKIHITHEGLYAAQNASANALNLFFKHLDKIKENILELRDTSKQLRFEVVTEETNLKLASIDAGRITLEEREVDAMIAQKMKDGFENFSFIDVNLETGSISFTATAIDEVKGSVLDITATEKQILIVPKYRCTFESIIDFYRGVVESIDEHAKLSLLDYSE